MAETVDKMQIIDADDALITSCDIEFNCNTQKLIDMINKSGHFINTPAPILMSLEPLYRKVKLKWKLPKDTDDTIINQINKLKIEWSDADLNDQKEMEDDDDDDDGDGDMKLDWTKNEIIDLSNVNKDENEVIIDKIANGSYLFRIGCIINEKISKYSNLKSVIMENKIEECFDADACDANCCLNADQSIITKTRSSYGTNYLSQIVNSGVHKWKFKLLAAQGYTINIGLWKTKYPIKTNEFLSQQDKQYAYQLSHGCLTTGKDGRMYTDGGTYGKNGCEIGDIIEMILNLEDRTIRFSINDEDAGIAYKDIEPISYRAAVGLYYNKDSIEFISYKST